MVNGAKELPRLQTAEAARTTPPNDAAVAAGFRVDSTLGQKRTASGHVKSPSSATSLSPSGGGASRGHSRQTSASSTIGEVREPQLSP